MSQPFKLTIELLTPFYMGHRITLDGLLSAAIYNATGLTGADNAALVPLDQDHGIFKGSSLFLDEQYRHRVVGRIMALKGASDLNTDAFSPNGRGNKYVFIDPQREAYKYNMTQYQGIETESVTFYGVGDGEQCRLLVENFIFGIGKRSNAGAGQIGEVSVDYLESDQSWMTEQGMPARPLPIELWNEIGGDTSAPFACIPVCFPYWESEGVKAVFPTSLSSH